MRQLLFLLSFFLSMLACAQSGFVVLGTVRGANDSTKVYLCQTLSDYPTDSTYIIGERFTFKGSLEHPIEYAVQIPDAEDEEESKECIFWLENSRITINGSLDDFSNAKVSGSASQLSYVKYMTEVSKVAEERNSSYFDSVSLKLTESLSRNIPRPLKAFRNSFSCVSRILFQE